MTDDQGTPTSPLYANAGATPLLTMEQGTYDPAALAGPRPVPQKSIWQFEITKKKVKRKDLMHFSRQLAVFIRAGIPILQALDAITEEMGNKRFKEVLLEIADKLRAGSTFSGATDGYPDIFPAYYRGILRSAELTGELDIALDKLSDYIERDLEARRKIVSALVYPGIVVGFAVVVVIVLTAYVLPKFEDFFNNLNAKLPLATRMLLSTAHFLTTWWFLFVGLLLLVVLLFTLGAKNQRGREIRDRLILQAPILGDVVHHALLERFCRVLSSMVTAGVTLPEAMAVTTQAVNNFVFKKGLDDARAALLRGEGLARPLAATGLFPAAARQMFIVGESTGSLDDQLGTAAAYFDRELDYKIKRFTTIFEPVTILFVGVIVGFVAVALVSAMYGIFRQVKV